LKSKIEKTVPKAIDFLTTQSFSFYDSKLKYTKIPPFYSFLTPLYLKEV